jgi:hypothetical protein
MTHLLIAATVIAVFPIIFAFFMQDIYLGDTQNAVEQEESTAAESRPAAPVQDLEKHAE